MMIRISRDEEKNLRNILAIFDEGLLLDYHPYHPYEQDRSIMLAHLILRRMRNLGGHCEFSRSVVQDRHSIIEFYLCILFVAKIQETLKLQLQSKGKYSDLSIVELSQSFEEWFKTFHESSSDHQHRAQNYPRHYRFLHFHNDLDQLKQYIGLSQNIAVHRMFHKEPQTISSVVSRLSNFLSSLPVEPDRERSYNPFMSYEHGPPLLSRHYKGISVEILKRYNIIVARTNRIQNDVARLIKLNDTARKTKPRPTLNFHCTEDESTIFDYYMYDQRLENDLQLDRQEQMETSIVDQKGYDGSETSAVEGDDANDTEKYDQDAQELGSESYASEDDASSFDSQASIGNKTEGFTHVHTFSLEDDEVKDISSSEWEWEVMSGVESVKSYGGNELMFTYKDALQVQVQANRNLSSAVLFPKGNAYHKTTPFQSSPLPGTIPTATTSTMLEEKEDEFNAEFDAYFEYEAYKGGRGRNWMLKEKRKTGRDQECEPRSWYKYKRRRGRVEFKKLFSF